MSSPASVLHPLLRSLGRSPALTLAAVLTLALGIGVNTALFQVVDAVLLRPLALAAPEALVVVLETHLERGLPRVEVSHPNFLDWQRESRSFVALAALPDSDAFPMVLSGGGEARQVRGAPVTGGFFGLLGARALHGRLLGPEDDRAGAPRVAVLGHALWRERYGADPALVGRTVTLDGAPHEVVGVLPQDFDYPASAELFVALVPNQSEYAVQRGTGWLKVVGRLREGVTVEQARAELDALVPRLVQRYGEGHGRGARVARLTDDVLGEAGPALRLLMGAVALVLLIACANVGNLLLMRSAARRRELAIQRALGASEGRLLREQLLEALLLCAAGAALALPLAVGALAALRALAPRGLPRADSLALEPRAFLFAAALALLATGVCGAAPALLSRRVAPAEVLRGGAPAGLAPPARRLRRLLVAVEVALAVVVLAGAGLLGRSLARLQGVELGFRPERTLSLQLTLSGERFASPGAQRAFWDALLPRLGALPGVEAAGASLLRPLELGPVGVGTWYLLPGQPPAAAKENPVLNYQAVTPDYFRAMGVPLLRGRAFTDADREGAAGVAVVGESTARRLWPGADAVGQRLAMLGSKASALRPEDFLTVVGVVPDVRHRELTHPLLDVYAPLAQSPEPASYVVLRHTGESEALVAAVRREVAALSPDVPVSGVTTLGRLVHEAQGPQRVRGALLALFALLALALAAVGVAGVVGWSVTERTHEYGVRMALGARGRDVLWLAVRQGAVPALWGVGAGLVAARLLGGLLQGLLYEVAPADPWVLGGAAAALLALALLSSLLPARRAARVDPALSLRGG